VGLTGIVLVSLYWTVATVGVWRSATRSWTSPVWMDRIWAATARFLAVVYFGWAMWGLVNGGAYATYLRVTGE
jgi:hypothetical protein